MKMNEHIYLIGFMGVGKSATAEALARKIGAPLYDMDSLIEKRENMSVSEIFEKYGEAGFRERESAVLKDLADMEPGVVSCGGGVVKNSANIKLLKDAGKVVYLTASPETILSRVVGRDNRPLLRDHMSVEGIEELLVPRLPFYEKAMDIGVSTDKFSPEEVANRIIAVLDIK